MKNSIYIFPLWILINLAHASEVWIWPAAYPKMRNFSDTAYVLQVQFPKQGPKVSLGPSPWPWKLKELHLVFRFERRPLPEEVDVHFKELAYRWEGHGVRVAGIQLDYDCPTSKLADYAYVVREIRKRLPPQYQLSVTGLYDWFHKPSLKHFGKDVPLYFQLYHGLHPVAVATNNLSPTIELQSHFKLGLLPEQSLDPLLKKSLEKDRRFKGLVYFYGVKNK